MIQSRLLIEQLWVWAIDSLSNNVKRLLEDVQHVQERRLFQESFQKLICLDLKSAEFVEGMAVSMFFFYAIHLRLKIVRIISTSYLFAKELDLLSQSLFSLWKPHHFGPWIRLRVGLQFKERTLLVISWCDEGWQWVSGNYLLLNEGLIYSLFD